MNIKGTQSEKNIKTALLGESLARNKYTYFAIQARKEGHYEIADMFETMAKNESNHVKIWFSILNDGLGSTKENLRDAAEGENGEWMSMYPNFAYTARKEGLDELAIMFEKVAEIEKDHEKVFLKSIISLNSNNTISKVKEEYPRLTKKLATDVCFAVQHMKHCQTYAQFARQ